MKSNPKPKCHWCLQIITEPTVSEHVARCPVKNRVAMAESRAGHPFSFDETRQARDQARKEFQAGR